jgi:polyisoprenoid-binding protein YceI
MGTTSTVSAPVPGELAGGSSWRIDPAHSHVEFAVRHLMISTVKGAFGDVRGTVWVDESDARTVLVDITIQVASIDTRQEQRDAHLRSADFFDAARFPTITFRSRLVEGNHQDSEFRLVGDLTIRDVTREVVLDVSSEGRLTDPWGAERAGFSARGKIDRTDFGLTWNQMLEAGGVVVGNEVKISIEVELVRQVTEAAA